tara:strand:- start:2882 stop:3688 length:807 start_codon:yes stop_codon:yes gene_type:complete
MVFTTHSGASAYIHWLGQKKLGAMQPYFFPYLGYFQLINEVDIFVLYDKVSYRKSSWINRNRIKDKGTSQPVLLTVPVQHPKCTMPIAKVRITENDDWKAKVKNLIYYNYKKAPFFDEIFDFIVDLIFNDEKSLHKYNSHIILKICERLGIQASIVIENEAHEQVEADLSTISNADGMLKQHRIVKLCSLYDAKDYINPINGMSLYDFDFFERNNKQLHFIEAEPIEYPQFFHPYLENMSIIDVLMHNGFDGTKELLQYRKLIHHGPH